MRVAVLTAMLISAATSLAISARAAACTAFLLATQDELAVAKSYDWHTGQALLLVNKRRVAKQAIPARPGDRPARWVSRYASLTFNQYGREMPIGGMNERGLVVETLWLDRSRYPAADRRPMITELQWVQLQLDLFDSVAQVVAAAPKTRIASVYARVHYLVCDASGACATIENVDGVLAVTAGRRLAARVLTNDTYADSLRFLRQHRGFGGKREPPAGSASLARFARAAAHAAKRPDKERAVDARAFDILNSVSMGAYSKWNIVYLPRQHKVLFRTHRRDAIRSVDLARFDGSCRAPVMMLDIDAELSGDVTARFTAYQTARNSALLAQTMAPIAARLPPDTVKQLASYPERLVCTADRSPATGHRSPPR